MVVSPDVGGVVRARALAKRLDNAPLAIVDKRREKPGESEVMNIIGDVDGPLLHPDRRHRRFGRARCATPPRRCKRGGRRGRRRLCTHGVLSGGAVARVEASELSELVITDSIGSHDAIAGSPQDPPPDHRAVARRGDAPDRRRELGVVAVRLKADKVGGILHPRSC